MHKLFPEQQLAKPQTFVGKLKGYLKRHRRGLRWVVLFVLVAYGLASCMVTRTLAIMGVEYITGYSPTYTDFPLGQNKRLNLEVRSYVKHLYCIGMRTELLMAKPNCTALIWKEGQAIETHGNSASKKFSAGIA